MEFLGFPPLVDAFPGIDYLGSGCRISATASVFRPLAQGATAVIRVGEHVAIFDYVRLLVGDASFHLEIGDRTMINVGCYISGEGGLSIAEDVLIGPHVKLLSAGHAIHGCDPLVAKNPITRGRIRIERGAWIGAGAIVLQDRVVGEGAVVGAGSIVTRDIEPWSIVVGNPARVIGYRHGHESRASFWRRLLARVK